MVCNSDGVRMKLYSTSTTYCMYNRNETDLRCGHICSTIISTSDSFMYIVYGLRQAPNVDAMTKPDSTNACISNDIRQ